QRFLPRFPTFSMRHAAAHEFALVCLETHLPCRAPGSRRSFRRLLARITTGWLFPRPIWNLARATFLSWARSTGSNMSRHYVNSAWSDYYGFGGEVFFVDCGDVDDTFAIDARDVLSDPSIEDLEASGLSLWPRGAAWGSPDGEPPDSNSVIAG